MTFSCIEPTHLTKDKDGYPRVKHQGRLWRLNRLIWTLSYGPIQDGCVVGHACNNKGCINVQHLYLTTAQQNSTDAAKDGLYKSGQEHPKSRWSIEQSNDMWERFHTLGQNQSYIGRVYGISQTRVSEVIRRVTKEKGKCEEATIASVAS